MRSDQVAGMTNELAPRRGRGGKTEKRPGEQWGLAEGRTARTARTPDAAITVSIDDSKAGFPTGLAPSSER